MMTFINMQNNVTTSIFFHMLPFVEDSSERENKTNKWCLSLNILESNFYFLGSIIKFVVL